MQSLHRAVADSAGGLLAPRSKTRAGVARERGPGKLHQSFGSAAASDDLPPLTVREISVIEYLAKGLLYKEIADEMGISFSSVHKLQHKIFVKLHVGNRTEAVNKWNGAMRT
jgi:DNA-binding NarL/FixJ family response regulator